MKRKLFFALALATVAMLALFRIPTPVRSADSTSTALTGAVSSQEEGLMEGVLVSAKKADSTVTVTVVSDAQGRYSFPRVRLEPGRYSLRMRAVGYEMDDAGPLLPIADASQPAVLFGKLRGLFRLRVGVFGRLRLMEERRSGVERDDEPAMAVTVVGPHQQAVRVFAER